MINARIYNYSNLQEEDKRIVESNLELISTVDSLKTDISKRSNMGILEEKMYEASNETLRIVKKELMEKVIQFIAESIEQYQTDVNEIDTDDYLYGLMVNE